jgi:hypothetical protein
MASRPRQPRLIIWLGIGLVLYFVYGRHHSVLTRVANGTNGVVGAGSKAEADIEPVAGR